MCLTRSALLLAPPPSILPPFFFFNDTATTEIYTLSLHDALPISPEASARAWLRRSSRATPRPASPHWRDAPSHAPSPRRRSAAGRTSSTRRRGPPPGGRLTPPRPRSPETRRGRRPSASP